MAEFAFPNDDFRVAARSGALAVLNLVSGIPSGCDEFSFMIFIVWLG